MPTKKPTKKAQATYSYEEYLDVFRPKPLPEHEPVRPVDPDEISKKLAEQAIKRVKQALSR